MSVIWHDIECGAYTEDLPVWRSLVDAHGDPVLDVGAGTGRVTLDLSRRGHRVTALDRDSELLAELDRRAAGLPVQTVCADACAFALEERFALCLVPMQTIQLLQGREERVRFLERARLHLRPHGLLAVAITETIECYELDEGFPAPLPDMLERDGAVYFSQPTAIRAEAGGYVLERRRERVSAAGQRTVEENQVRLETISRDGLEGEGRAAGLTPAGCIEIPATADHVGSLVVMLRA